MGTKAQQEPGARYYNPAIARVLSPDSIVQSAGNPQSLARYSYCENNPLVYVDPTGHFDLFGSLLGFVGFLSGDPFVAIGMIAAGAGFGAAMSAMTGHNPGMGALTGAISAFAFMGAHYLTAGMDLLDAAVIHGAVGAATGAINAAIAGTSPGFGALTGGISGGIARGMGGLLPDGFAAQLGGRMLTGAVAGGITAAIVGGDFKQGMFNGAWTAGFGYLFNETGQELGKMVQGMFQQAGIGTDPGHLFNRSDLASLNPGFTAGQRNALITTGAGAFLTVYGFLTLPEGAPVTGIGAAWLTKGLTLDLVEFGFKGNTATVPFFPEYEAFGSAARYMVLGR